MHRALLRPQFPTAIFPRYIVKSVMIDYALN
jgi:hypothetical protein